MIKYLALIALFLQHWPASSQVNDSGIDTIIVAITSQLPLKKDQADSINNLASKYFKSNPSLAWHLSEEALKISIEEGYQEGQARAHYLIGSSQAYEQYALALEHLIKCRKLSSELDNVELEASALLSISTVYHGMGKVDKAIQTVKAAQEIAGFSNNKKTLSRIHSNLASYYYDSDSTSLALKHSRLALNLKKEINDSYGLRLSYLNLGAFLAEYDSTVDEGIEYLKMARKLSKDDPIMLNDVMANMIWAYSQKQNYDLCLNYLDSALLGNDTIDNMYTRQAIHRLGKEVYLVIGDYENAYLQATQEYEVDKQLRGKEVDGRFQILELENENHEKENQIILLERKRSEAQLKFIYAVSFAGLFLMLLGVLYKSYRLKKKLLEDLKSKQLEIQEKSHLLEIKNKETEQFAYVASHDLKAPLNTIISCINMIKDEIDLKLDDQSKQIAGFIASSANRMKLMISSLLDHGRLGSNIKFEEVDINQLVRNLRQDLRQLINETKAELEINYLPKVKGSETELRLLFQNLITNGIKFSSSNQIPKISISYKSLKRAKRHQFSIKDNGVGIPEDRQEKVFKLFERAHGNEFEGSGIGLAHCQKIVKLHKGSIWFDSEEGEGTTFHFVLPMKDWTNTDSLQIERINN